MKEIKGGFETTGVSGHGPGSERVDDDELEDASTHN